MPTLTCFTQCPVIEPEEIPTNNYRDPGSGGGGDFTLFTADSDQVTLSGNGTAESPLMAELISGQTINFEIAMGKVTGIADGEFMAVYVNAKPCTIPAGLVGSEFYVEGQVGDILLNIEHNGVVVGNIEIVAGVPNATLAADIVMAEGDRLELFGGATAEFSLLAVTLLGLRALDYVA